MSKQEPCRPTCASKKSGIDCSKFTASLVRAVLEKKHGVKTAGWPRMISKNYIVVVERKMSIMRVVVLAQIEFHW